MQIIQKKQPKKSRLILLLVTILFALVALGYGGYWYLNKSNNKPASQEQLQAGESAKTQTINNDDKGSSTGSDRQTTQNEQINDKEAVSLQITASNVNDSTYQVRVLIEKITSSGACTLTMSQGTKSYTMNASIQSLPNGSTCKGFDVPLSELSTGTWTVTVNYTSDEATSSTSTEVVIK